MKAKDIKVGARVRISPRSEFYSKNAKEDSPNPIHCYGTIYKYDDSGFLGIFVKWDNGKENSYDPEDLVPAGGKDVPRYFYEKKDEGEFNIFHRNHKDEEPTWIGTTDTAEKADFLVKGANNVTY
jgi:hypothetical protein